MKVSDSNSSTLEYSKSLDDRMRKQVKAKETELENQKKIYENKIESAKLEGEERYINALKRNDEMLTGAGLDYEEKLNNYKENLDHAQKNMSRTEMALKNDHAEKMLNLKEQYNTNIQDQYMNARENQQMVQGQVKSTVDQIADKARAERNHLETKSKAEINALSSEYNQKGVNEERDYRAKLTADVRAHEEAVRLQKTELKNVIDKEMQQNKRLETEKVQIQKAELDFLDNHQKDLIAQRHADFKVRYESMVKEHNAILNDIKTHLEADVKKMIADTSTQKRMIASKNDDRFYRVETLNPSVSETEKDYTVSLKLPEHEKENAHLSVHGREVKLTFTRRYSETLEAEDGSSNKSTRNELYSKEFNCKDILNPKLISQKYENGILSYKIQKL